MSADTMDVGQMTVCVCVSVCACVCVSVNVINMVLVYRLEQNDIYFVIDFPLSPFLIFSSVISFL